MRIHRLELHPLCTDLHAWLLIALASLGATAAIGQSPVEVNQVAAGVYVVQPPAAMRFDESNAVVIIRQDGVLVVDTQTAPSAARVVIAEIRKLTTIPVRRVVYTHWHGDHVGLANGNPASFIQHFEKLAPELAAEGIECINASRATALTCFPRATLADALASHVEMA